MANQAWIVLQKLQEVNDEAEARKRGFPKGNSFKLLQRDIILVPEEKSREVFERNAREAAKNALATA